LRRRSKFIAKIEYAARVMRDQRMHAAGNVFDMGARENMPLFDDPPRLTLA